MCNGEFMIKELEEAYDFLEQLAGSFEAYDTYKPKKKLTKGKNDQVPWWGGV